MSVEEKFSEKRAGLKTPTIKAPLRFERRDVVNIYSNYFTKTKTFGRELTALDII